ncbi:MAG: GDP-mannose 4,6-dehydratase [Chloroflexota bacterium]
MAASPGGAINDLGGHSSHTQVAVVTGATGQDGFYLVRRLIGEGVAVHAIARERGRRDDLRRLAPDDSLTIHELELTDGAGYRELVAGTQPDEFYNLAGQSSVAASFGDPTSTWRTNADAVQSMLEAIRLDSPHTRFYQSSSIEMFGAEPGQTAIQDETSPLMPQSPYAAAKAAAHVVCDAYRRSFGLRVAAGILANHESRRRPSTFLTRKVVDHVRAVVEVGTAQGARQPLAVGNLAAQRDWGFAPDYVEGMVRILRQIEVRATTSGRPVEPDLGSNYRDYVLGSGRLHAVWELVDRAFALAGLSLTWDRADPDSANWSAVFDATGATAVVVDPQLMRPTDPAVIRADPSRAQRELGWTPRPGLDRFLRDMLGLDDGRVD